MKYYSVFLLFNLFKLHSNPDIITQECILYSDIVSFATPSKCCTVSFFSTIL